MTVQKPVSLRGLADELAEIGGEPPKLFYEMVAIQMKCYDQELGVDHSDP
jgi:hypothetical protein